MGRFAAMYFVTFAVLASVAPYLALELKDRGISGLVWVLAISALPAGRLVAAPLWGLVADRFRVPGRVLTAASLVALLGLAGVIVAPGALVVLAMLVFALGRGPTSALLDSMVLGALGSDRDEYGRIRRYGSLGFLLFVGGTGWARDAFGLSPLWLGLAMSVVLVVGAASLSEVDARPRSPVLVPMKKLLADRDVALILLVAVAHFAGHICVSMFLAVHFEALGIEVRWAGIALALGVAVEVVLLSYGRVLLTRISALSLYRIAVVVAVPRWLITALATDPVVLVGVQAVHGITFGGFWLAGVTMIAARAPDEVRASSQAVFTAAVGGVGALVGTLFGTIIVEVLHTRALYLADVVVALVAVGLSAMIRPRRPDAVGAGA